MKNECKENTKTIIELSECQTKHNKKIEENFQTTDNHADMFRKNESSLNGIRSSIASVDKKLGTKINKLENTCNEFRETLKYLGDKIKDHSRWEFTKADLSFANLLQEKIKTDVPNVIDYTEFKDKTSEFVEDL